MRQEACKQIVNTYFDLEDYEIPLDAPNFDLVKNLGHHVNERYQPFKVGDLYPRNGMPKREVTEVNNLSVSFCAETGDDHDAHLEICVVQELTLAEESEEAFQKRRQDEIEANQRRIASLERDILNAQANLKELREWQV